MKKLTVFLWLIGGLGIAGDGWSGSAFIEFPDDTYPQLAEIEADTMVPVPIKQSAHEIYARTGDLRRTAERLFEECGTIPMDKIKAMVLHAGSLQVDEKAAKAKELMRMELEKIRDESDELGYRGKIYSEVYPFEARYRQAGIMVLAPGAQLRRGLWDAFDPLEQDVKVLVDAARSRIADGKWGEGIEPCRLAQELGERAREAVKEIHRIVGQKAGLIKIDPAAPGGLRETHEGDAERWVYVSTEGL